MSDNVSYLASFPETAAISGDFSVSSEHFYVSSTDTRMGLSLQKAPPPFTA